NHVPSREARVLSYGRGNPYVSINTTREHVVPPTGERGAAKVSQRPDALHDNSIKRLIAQKKICRRRTTMEIARSERLHTTASDRVRRCAAQTDAAGLGRD